MALLDEVVLVIFKDKTLQVYDAELIRNRLSDIRPFSEPETMQAVEENRERCLAAWSAEIDGAACGRTEETVEVNVDVDTDILELTEQWCLKANITAEKLMLALLRFGEYSRAAECHAASPHFHGFDTVRFEYSF